MSKSSLTIRLVPLLFIFCVAPSVFAQAEVQTPEFTRLDEPTVLEQLEISDEQRAQLATLRQEQAAALGLNDEQARVAGLAKVQAALEELLTAEQLKQFRALPSEPGLTFNFRETEWLDVLDWFARQAKLSLVVNTAPPGTFTYSDSKAYTPVEALDLLNGVLVTRGFTLIRRERMLICIDLSEGVPAGMLPRAAFEELDQYGNFELVEVMFPLEGRPAEGVAEEITPLLGNFGQATPLPQTNQLLVWTTAGKMRAISAVIASIPVPKKAAAAASPSKKAPKAELKVYPVEKLDLEATVATLEKMLSSATFTMDSRAQQINALAVPTQHEVIQQMLDQMMENASTDTELRLESYPVETSDLTELMSQLSAISPGTTINSATDPPRILVYGDALTQEQIKAALDKLEATAVVAGDQSVKIYRLEQAEPEAFVEAVRNIFPRISLTIDNATKRIIVVGSEAEHALIEKMSEQLDAQLDQPKVIKYYPQPKRSRDIALRLLKSFVPEAEIQQDAGSDQLLIIADEASHVRVTDLLRQLQEGEIEPPQQELRIYTLSPQQRDYFIRNYKRLDPELERVEILGNSPAGELRILTDVTRHQRINDLVEQTQKLFPVTPRQLRFYVADADLRAQFTRLRGKLAPELTQVEMVEDVTGRGMGVIASEEEHQRVALLLEQLERQIPQRETSLRVYPVQAEQRQRFTALLPSLGDKLPDVRVIDGSPPNEIAIWAPQEQHNKVETLLESLKTDRRGMELVTYPLQSGDPASVQTVLAELYPDAKIVGDNESRRLMVWSNAEQQQQIRKAVEQLDKPSTAGTRKMSYYRLGDVDVRDVIEILQGVVADMTLIADRSSNSVIAWGLEKDHQLLKETVEEFRNQAETEKRILKTYPCGARQVNEVRRIIDDLAPRSRIVADETNRSVIVWANPDEHETIQAAITQMTEGQSNDIGTIKAYRVDKIEASSLRSMLATLVPLAQVTASSDETQVLVRASEADHQTIAGAVKQLESGTPLQENGRLKIYESRPEIVLELSTLVPEIGTDVRLIENGDPKKLAVYATDAEHQRLEKLIGDLEKQIPDDPLVIASYPLEQVSSAEAMQVVEGIVPTAQFFDSADTDRLLVRASTSDQRRIEQALQELKQAKGNPEATELKPYAVGDNEPSAILALLDSEVTRDLSIIPDATRKSLLVRATPEGHEDFSAALDGLLKGLPEIEKPVSRVYRLRFANPATARDSLAELMPSTNFALDQETRSLMATALPSEHELIGQAVSQLDVQPDAQRETRVYRFQDANAAATRSVLIELLPNITMAANAEDRALLVTATPAEHQVIKDAVDEMNRDDIQKTTRVYRFQKGGNIESAREVLQSLAPQAVMSVDELNKALLVTAEESDHQRIEPVIQQLDRNTEDVRQTRVYRFKYADVNAAQVALQALMSNAMIAVDSASRALVATATSEDHERIGAAVKELDVQRDDPTEARVYPFLIADVNAAQQVLRSLLPNAVIAVDQPNRILVATATVAEHAKIATIAKSMDVKNDRQPSLQSYSVRQANAQAVFDAVRQMYDGNPAVALSLDSENRAILVRAPVQEQLNVAKIVSQMDNAVPQSLRRLEVYALVNGDQNLVATLKELVETPSQPVQLRFDERSRQLVVVGTDQQHKLITDALERIKQDEVIVEVFPLEAADPFAVQMAIEQLYDGEPNRPIANGDTETQQLFVRGTADQIETIRGLLKKMGEIPLETASRNGVRVIPFRGDLKRAVEQIEQVWPQLRENKIQVLESLPAERVESLESGSEESADEPLDDEPQNPVGDQTNANDFQTQAVAAEEGQDSSDKEMPPAILIVPGEGSVTLMSDDDEALEQAAMLFYTLARRGAGQAGAGNFAVINLRNAGARNVAKLLDDLFEQMPITARTTLGRVSIVADDRLNALVIHGRPADRIVVTELLRVLDSSSVPDTLANARPRIIPLIYSDADRILEILQGVYESQLQSGGSRPEISIPEGISTEVASVLQQINAATAGPLLTLQVDRVTNSIVLLAPRELGEEVYRLIEELDQQAEQKDTRNIGVISLKSVNVESIEEALEALLQD